MKNAKATSALRIVGALALAGASLGGLPGCAVVPVGGYYGGGYGYGGTSIYVAPSYGGGHGYGHGYGRSYGHSYGQGGWGGGYGRGGWWRY